MSERGVTLTREDIVKTFLSFRGDVFRLRITASDEVLMPRHIFGHQRRLVNPTDNTQGDEFCFVTSPFDATIYPADEPDEQQFPPFFRKDVIDILVPSTEAAEKVWTEIQAEVNNLVEAYNRLDDLLVTETVRCGAELAGSVSDSESS